MTRNFIENEFTSDNFLIDQLRNFEVKTFNNLFLFEITEDQLFKKMSEIHCIDKKEIEEIIAQLGRIHTKYMDTY